MSREIMERVFDQMITSVVDADEIDETIESPALLAREAARSALEEIGEEPSVVYEMEGGFAVMGSNHAIFMGHDGSFDLSEIPDEVPDGGDVDDDDPDDDGDPAVVVVEADDDDETPTVVNYADVQKAVETALANKSIHAEGLTALRSFDAARLDEDAAEVHGALARLEEVFDVDLTDEKAKLQEVDAPLVDLGEADLDVMQEGIASALGMSMTDPEAMPLLRAFDEAYVANDLIAAVNAVEVIESTFGIKVPRAPKPKTPRDDGPGVRGAGPSASGSRLRGEDEEDDDSDDLDEGAAWPWGKLMPDSWKVRASKKDLGHAVWFRQRVEDLEVRPFIKKMKAIIAAAGGETLTAERIGDYVYVGGAVPAKINAKKAYTLSGRPQNKIGKGGVEVSGGMIESDDLDEVRGDGRGQGGPAQGDGGASTCKCPKCGATITHERGTPCMESKCPKCGAQMVGEDYDETQVIFRFPESRVNEFIEIAQKAGAGNDCPVTKDGENYAFMVPESVAKKVRLFFKGDDVSVDEQAKIKVTGDKVNPASVDMAVAAMVRELKNADKVAMLIVKQAPKAEPFEKNIAHLVKQLLKKKASPEDIAWIMAEVLGSIYMTGKFGLAKRGASPLMGAQKLKKYGLRLHITEDGEMSLVVLDDA